MISFASRAAGVVRHLPHADVVSSARRHAASRVAKQIMSVTPNAAIRLHSLMSQRDDPSTIGVRVGLRTRGCNGMSYTMDYTDKVNKFDEVVDAENGVKVVVDSK